MRLGLGQRSLEPLTSQTVGASLLFLSGLGMSSGPPPTVGGSRWAGGDRRGPEGLGLFLSPHKLTGVALASVKQEACWELRGGSHTPRGHSGLPATPPLCGADPKTKR